MSSGWGATLYKARGVPTKQPVCAICVERTRGRTTRINLGYGVHVCLCEYHSAAEFQRRRGGRDFVLTLQRLWESHGCLTANRHRALTPTWIGCAIDPRVGVPVATRGPSSGAKRRSSFPQACRLRA